MQLPSMLRGQMSNSARRSSPSSIERQAKSSRIRKLARSSGELGAGIFFADFRTRSSSKLRPTRSALWRSPTSGAALHIWRVASSVLQRILNALQQILKCAIIHGPTPRSGSRPAASPAQPSRRPVRSSNRRIPGSSGPEPVRASRPEMGDDASAAAIPPVADPVADRRLNSSSVGSTSLLAKLLLADLIDVAGALVLPL